MLVRLTDLDGYRITGATVIVRDGVQYAVERERVERGGALVDVLVRRRG
jgi:hypothetical protein